MIEKSEVSRVVAWWEEGLPQPGWLVAVYTKRPWVNPPKAVWPGAPFDKAPPFGRDEPEKVFAALEEAFPDASVVVQQ